MIEQYLNNRLITLYILPLVLGSLTVFSFQPFNYTFINFIILPILFYLIVFIKKKSKSVYRIKPFKKNLFIFGTIFGFSFYLSNIYWITNSLTFDESFKVLIPIGLIFIPLFLSLFYSITFVILGSFLNFNLSSIFLFSAGLAISDYFKAKILSGFPWNLWIYSFSWATEIIQILNKLGLFASNLILITLFLLPALFFFKINYVQKIFSLFLIFISGFIFYIYGSHSINQNNENLKSVKEKFYTKVISPNFELKYGVSIKENEIRLNKLIKYSEPNKNIKTLFVWPEGVFSGNSFEDIQKFKHIFAKNFSDKHYILFGINRINSGRNGFYNTLVIVNNNLEIIKEYNKQKLVPFGEFLPFENLLNKIGLKKITEGHGSFTSGNKKGQIKLENLNILPLICYEIIFTQFVQSSNENINLIVNISEDGWFGDSIGLHQHFTKAIYRAIESNTFLIRSANKGISSIINNKGEIVKKLNPNESGSIELEIPLIKNAYKNKNDLIFFILLITYISFFKYYKK